MTDKEIIETLAAISSMQKRDKLVAMEMALKDTRFRHAVILSTDTAITFGVSNIKPAGESMLNDSLDFLIKLAEESKGNATKQQKEALARVAAQGEHTHQLIQKILRGRLDCGIGEKTLHENFPGIVPYYPYMRCSGVDELDRIISEMGWAYSQLKDNGLYLDIIVGDEVQYRTRNGNSLKMRLGVEQSLSSSLVFSGTLMGEATLLSPCGTFTMPRAAGNAIISQAIHEDMPKNIVERVRIKLWDFVPIDSYRAMKEKMTYSERLDDLDNWLCDGAQPSVLKYFDLIETREVRSIDEVWNHFEEVKSRPVADGAEELEGLVVKSPKAIWKDGTSKDQAKVKDVKECELRIVDWVPGRDGSKYEGMIGSLTLQSECGGLVVNSSGITDEVRKKDPDSIIGTVVSVLFTSVTTNKNKTTASLDNPRITDLRSDKSVADDLEYIKRVKSIKRRKSE